MPKLKLTKRVIDDAKPVIDDDAKPGDSRYIVWDTEVRGLGLRVETTGLKNFVLYYRTTNGTQRKPTVGQYGAITLQQARDIAQDMLAVVRAGGDPSGARKDSRQAPTVEEACEKFVKEHVALKKPRTREQYESLLDRFVKPALGSQKVASVQHDDLTRLIRRVGKQHPIAANRLRAVLSKLFSSTEKWQWRPTGSNPCTHIERYHEEQRHRDLSEAEMQQLAGALDADENQRAAAAIRLLMFTGCRRNEVLHLQWSEVDLQRGFLRLGDSKTGAKIVHLNVAARDVLEAQSKIEGNPYVFPSEKLKTKSRPLRDAKRTWERIRERAQLEGLC